MVWWYARPQIAAVALAACLLTGGAGQQLRQGNVLAAAPSLPRVAGVQTGSISDCAQATRPCVAVTFDDGPDSIITPQVLDILARNNVRATFFLVGREVAGREDIVRRIVRDGHEIGNHTWSHPDMTRLPASVIREQVQSTQMAIASAGVPLPHIFRPPYGAVNAAVRAHVPMPLIRWDVDTQDWFTQDPAQIAWHAMNDVQPGGIILMHDRYAATVAALEPTLQYLQTRFQLVTVSELMTLSAGDQGQFFNRK